MTSKRGLLGRDRVERDPLRAASGVGEDGVPVAERAAPESCPERRTGVPSRRSIPNASISPPAQSISGRPLAYSARFFRSGLQLRVDLEARRARVETARTTRARRRARVALRDRARGAGGAASESTKDAFVRCRAPRRTRARAPAFASAQSPSTSAAAKTPSPDERVAVEARDRGVGLDLLVEERLRVARLVPLVVAVAAVADEVDDDVAPERVAVLDRDVDDVDDRLGVVAVHVEDRRLDHLRDVGAVRRRAGVGRVRREADLVVHDDVDRAARPVAVELRHVERLGHDPLAGERGVAVEEDGQDLAVLAVLAEARLLRADHPLDDGVDGLEVARVRGEAETSSRAPPGATCVPTAPRWYFTSPEPWIDCGVQHVLELREDLRHRLADDRREDGQPAAVRHPDDDLADAGLGGAVEEAVEERDRRLAAFEREALVADVLRVEELLEALGLDELPEDPLPVVVARGAPGCATTPSGP